MLFNTIEFAVFLPLVFLLYWAVTPLSLKGSNFLLLVSSYVFYGWWDWRFLFLVLFSSLADFTIALGMVTMRRIFMRRLLLLLSLVVNLGLLGFFKYFNFFVSSFADAFTLFGIPFEATRLQLILPVGISFYTFQTLSYSIDVYRAKIKPTSDLIAFLAFVSFFPQLVAGPIERAWHLLPQFFSRRKFVYEDAADGMRQILWGLFKKVVVADTCAMLVNDVFTAYDTHAGSTLLLAAVLFSFQIYGDFSGYSDIAIGTARLFGFDLMRNFAYPYFSRDIAEFWRRWHISLSTWFRDYLYIPLGGNRHGMARTVRNTFIVFLVSGIWHGASWTFVVWGLLHALYFLPLVLIGRHRSHVDVVASGRIMPSLREVLQISLTFTMTLIAWVFFRSQSVNHALLYLHQMFSVSVFTIPERLFERATLVSVVAIGLLMVVEWIQREKPHGLTLNSAHVPVAFRWSIYVLLTLAILNSGGSPQEFIYFQF